MNHTASQDPPATAPVVRDQGLDAVRGLGILLVVIGHALIRALDPALPGTASAVMLSGIGWVRMTPGVDAALTAIYSFHMPLLAFVSGLAFSRSSVGYGRSFLGRRAAGLLVPYFAWLGVAWLVVGDRTPAGLLRFFGSAAIDPQSPGALWFLYALFASSVVLAAVMALGGSDRALVASAAVVGLGGMLPLGAYSNVLGLSDVAWLYPFVAAGVIVARHRTSLERSRLLVPLALVLWTASLPFVWPVVVPGPRWWFPGVTAALAPLGTSVASLVAKALWALVRVAGALAGTYVAFWLGTRVRGALLTGCAWLGRRTLGVYATHSLILLALAPLVAPLAIAARVVALIVLALVAALAITLLLERWGVTRKVFLGSRA